MHSLQPHRPFDTTSSGFEVASAVAGLLRQVARDGDEASGRKFLMSSLLERNPHRGLASYTQPKVPMPLEPLLPKKPGVGASRLERGLSGGSL